MAGLTPFPPELDPDQAGFTSFQDMSPKGDTRTACQFFRV